MNSETMNSIFKNKKADYAKLLNYGFKQCGQRFEYCCNLNDSGFKMIVTVDENGAVLSTVIDTNFNEPYTLHLVEGVSGGFVGQVRSEYEAILADISDKCFVSEIFKCDYTKQLKDYVMNVYGDELEHLWKKWPQDAVWRRKDNKKWYGVILSVTKRKLGIDSDELVEIIDLRIAPDLIDSLVDNVNYFYGYHMNKKHWFTVILDGSVPFYEICSRLDESYIIAGKSK